MALGAGYKNIRSDYCFACVDQGEHLMPSIGKTATKGHCNLML